MVSKAASEKRGGVGGEWMRAGAVRRAMNLLEMFGEYGDKEV